MIGSPSVFQNRPSPAVLFLVSARPMCYDTNAAHPWAKNLLWKGLQE